MCGMKDTLVFDLETKKTLPEVGGEKNMKELGISVAGVWSYQKQAFFCFEEHELSQFEDLLRNTEHLIGFNINHFDIPVLTPYMKEVDLSKMAVTDLFTDAVFFLGHRVGLGVLAQATLGESKSGHGLEALEWFRQGRVEEVKKYCLDDVRLTRDLYEYGKKNHHILLRSLGDGKVHSIPVSWHEPVKKPIRLSLEEALVGRKRIMIEYISSEDNDGNGFQKMRKIDVLKIKKDEIEAFCHLRQAARVFRINRILRVEPVGETYTLPADVQTSLF